MGFAHLLLTNVYPVCLNTDGSAVAQPDVLLVEDLLFSGGLLHFRGAERSNEQ